MWQSIRRQHQDHQDIRFNNLKVNINYEISNNYKYEKANKHLYLYNHIVFNY